MWLPRLRNIWACLLITGAACISEAAAGLYGFSSENPLTREEELLDMSVPPRKVTNYRGEMRDNLLMLIDYARARNPQFQIMAHEGQYLLDKSLWEYHLEGYNSARRKDTEAEDPSFLALNNTPIEEEPRTNSPAYRYLHALNAIALNDLYCGNAQPSKLVTEHKIPIFAIDQCPTDEASDRAIIKSIDDRRPLYVFTDPDYAFIDIKTQPLINESARNILNLKDARNIVFLTDDRQYRDRTRLVHDLAKASYDVIVMKPVFHRRERFEPEEIERLKYKRNGGRRLVLAEMNVSEANPFDYYWNKRWQIGNPQWLVRPSTVDKHSVITQYWHPEWRQILSRHFESIVNSGFDGVLFTGLNNNQYFEKQTPLD